MEYRIIDADSHINEPGDVWQSRVPQALRDRAPKMVTLPDGRVGWSFDNGKRVKRVGTAQSGVHVTQSSRSGATPAQIRPASYDPRARLKEMEYDMVQAQVIYPSMALNGLYSYADDRDMQVACVAAYNDWIHEFSSVSPERLVGMPIAPATGVEDLLLEWRRVANRGDRGFVIASYPNGGRYPLPEDDRFWAEVQEWDYAAPIHFGFLGDKPASAAGDLPDLGYLTAAALNDLGVGIYRPIADMIHMGLFEKYPKLRIVAVETGIGWIPYFLQVLDNSFLRRRWASGIHLKRMPSEYFREHIWATFITDAHGLDNRHAIGVDRIMWSTDYPHNNSNWPDSQRFLEYELKNIPAEEKRKILRDNALKMYRLDAAAASNAKEGADEKKPKGESIYCLDGCGQKTRPGSKFKPGHDARLKSMLLKLSREQVKLKDLPAQVQKDLKSGKLNAYKPA